MMNKTYRTELEFIMQHMKEAYSLFNTAREVAHKDSFDLVTDVDFAIEKYLSQKLQECFPDDKILGEELNKNNSWDGRVWTIDPIDGTVNFANRIDIYGVQCSLVENGDVKLGAIYLPKDDSFYWALKGEGSFRNGKPIHTASYTQLQDTILSLGDFSHPNKQWYEHEQQLVRLLPDKVAKLRIFGAACYDFAMLAGGSTGAHIMFTTNAWDIYPGLIIALESGAVATNLQGEPYNLSDGCLLIAANEQICKEILSIVRTQHSVL